MIRCADCNSLLMKDEHDCPTCGASTQNDSKTVRRRRQFVTILNILLYASLALTLASIFVPNTPSFLKCLPVSLVLLLVRSSAGEMADKLE